MEHNTDLELTQSWVKHHQKSIELSRYREHELRERLNVALGVLRAYVDYHVHCPFNYELMVREVLNDHTR